MNIEPNLRIWIEYETRLKKAAENLSTDKIDLTDFKALNCQSSFGKFFFDVFDKGTVLEYQIVTVMILNYLLRFF